jgi:uncharacterized protein
MAGGASVNRVVVTDRYCANAFEKEKAYLRRFEVDRLAAGFRRTAGIRTEAKPYGGWETSLISGHFVGHYLTAVAQAYRSGGGEEFRSIASSLVDALALSQAPDGYLFATAVGVGGQAQFDHVEAGETDIRTQAWVPWYTMHKILAGLVSAYEMCALDKALACASRLGDWVYGRVSRWNDETRARTLRTEYGGMNDCLYELYKLTRKREHAIAAHAFDEVALFESIHAGDDVLDGRHANTTIPKFLGALNRYRAWREIGERDFEYARDERDIAFYLESAERFWAMVAGDHSYATGGNSDDEHFGPPGDLDAERSDVNCETCNTYNMQKLSLELYRLTGDKKYMDFYENAFINAILSSQNPDTGMTMYFQPMATGYFKVYSSAFDHFWCCTGTGTESFTKLGDGLYACDGDSLSVNLYLSSTFEWGDKGLDLIQESSIPERDRASFTVRGSGTFELRLRLPDWIAGKSELKLNGARIEVPEIEGYAIVDRSWADGDRLELLLPMRIVARPLSASDEVYAFKYGPVVLSAALGDNDLIVASHGVQVLKPASTLGADERIVIEAGRGPRARWLDEAEENFQRRDGRLEFALRHADRDLVFSPHYLQHRQRYGIYWRLLESGTVEKG